MEFVRKASGSAVVMTDADGRVLLVRRAYAPFDWVLPGGIASADESPVETALREVREELGIGVRLERMTGVYYQADHRAGEFIHFVFRGVPADGSRITAQPAEVAAYDYFAPDKLPEPMSRSTRLRLTDALSPAPPTLPVTLPPKSEPAR